MSIGTGPDYYNGINREEDERVKLGDTVQAWWESLEKSEKLDVLEGIYPDQVGLIDGNELWERSSWDMQLEAYKDANGMNEVEI